MPQAHPSPTTDSLSTQLDFMLLQLSMAAYLPPEVYKNLLSGDPILPQSTLESIVQELSQGRKFVESLPLSDTNGSAERPSVSLDTPVSHHIKVPENSPNRKFIHYLDAVYDPRTHNMTALIKLAGARHFQGTFKRATHQIALQLNEKGNLCISPVVSYKKRVTPGKTPNKVLAKNQLAAVMQEVTEQGALSHTCISGSANGGAFVSQRQSQPRAVDLNKGLDLYEALSTLSSKQQAQAVHNLCHYIVQVGEQLSNFHVIQNLTHGDVKLKNILFRRERHGTESIPCYTLIDYPDKDKSFDPVTSKNYTHPSNLLRTLGVSTPFVTGEFIQDMQQSLLSLGVKEKQVAAFSGWLESELKNTTRCGHYIDSYAFLYGFGEMVHNVLLATAHPSAELLDCKKFFVEAMGGLLDAIRSPDPMPLGYTVYGLRDLFQRRKCLASIMPEVMQATTKLTSQPKAKNFHELLANKGTELTGDALPSDTVTTTQPVLLSNNSSQSTAATALHSMVQQQITIGFWACIFDFFRLIRGLDTRAAAKQKLEAALSTLSSDNLPTSVIKDSQSRASKAIYFLINKGMVKTPSLRSQMVDFMRELNNYPPSPSATKIMRQRSSATPAPRVFRPPSTYRSNDLRINLEALSSTPIEPGLQDGNGDAHKPLGPPIPSHSKHKPKPSR